MNRRAVVGLVLLSACGGAPFSALDVTRNDAAPEDDGAALDAAPDVGPDAPQLVDAALDASADACETSVDAAPDASACPCMTDLSGIGVADLWIAFDVTTSATATTATTALLNQRAGCGFSSSYWDLVMPAGEQGAVRLEIGDGDGTTYIDDVSTTVPVNDGHPHHVVIARTGGATTFTLTVDGVGPTQTGGLVEPLGTLAPLQRGAETACGYAPLVGQLANVCLSVGCALH